MPHSPVDRVNARSRIARATVSAGTGLPASTKSRSILVAILALSSTCCWNFGDSTRWAGGRTSRAHERQDGRRRRLLGQDAREETRPCVERDPDLLVVAVAVVHRRDARARLQVVEPSQCLPSRRRPRRASCSRCAAFVQAEVKRCDRWIRGLELREHPVADARSGALSRRPADAGYSPGCSERPAHSCRCVEPWRRMSRAGCVR